MDFVVVSKSEIRARAIFNLVREYLDQMEGVDLVGEYDMDYLLKEDLEYLFFDYEYLVDYGHRLKDREFIKVKNLVCFSDARKLDYDGIKFINSSTSLLELESILNNKKIQEPQFDLEERDMSILFLLTKGATNREIGQKLYLSEKTIKNNLTRIYRELGVSSKYEAISLVMKNYIERK